MYDQRSYSLLAIAGVTPFIACALLPLVGVAAIGPLGPIDSIAASYGLAIVAFLTGVHWATQLYQRNRASVNLFFVSNVIFVAAWLAYVGGSHDAALSSQAIALLALLGIDRWLQRQGVITDHYFRIRFTATALAVISIGIVVLT